MTESGGHTRSEAVYLDAVSGDGEMAMVARLCRYPQRGVQWAWLHVFVGARAYSFTDHRLACGAGFTDLDAADALYEASAAELQIRFERRGAVAAPSAATLFAQVRAHAQDGASFVVPADGPGSVALSVKASFVPDAVPVSNRQGRHEMQGRVSAELIVAGQPSVLQARGHFHEQEQSDPRFTVPFTYATLRGEDFGLIFIRVARGCRGQFTEDSFRVSEEVLVDLQRRRPVGGLDGRGPDSFPGWSGGFGSGWATAEDHHVDNDVGA